jgi:hypothetical protein
MLGVTGWRVSLDVFGDGPKARIGHFIETVRGASTLMGVFCHVGMPRDGKQVMDHAKSVTRIRGHGDVKRRHFGGGFAAVLLMCLAGGAGAQGLARSKAPVACLHYEPTQVVLSGTLVERTYPGPPNYESVAQGDAAETGYYLRLRKPVCTQAREEDEASSHARVEWLQVVVMDKTHFAQLRPRLGKVVRLHGSLFEASTGHHHTDVLLTLKQID